MTVHEQSSSQHPERLPRLLKWSSFALELFFLWIFCNTLFLVPGPYFPARILIVGVAALLSAGAAWVSGRTFIKSSASTRSLISTPPCVICLFVLAVSSLYMGVAVLATR